ncbi:phage tail protein [Streptomyces europaeiscabiei]|uniref:phage tail protein n=1 Tax=Streptomyces europaeiscabiei TaxID=146819 RepID=UPI0029B452F7|nr:hypothetical protein [Streptomyces europaeiscabiei]MDX3582543.1 hypothetical protein [Streptomyces europaeiscabiei]
MALNLGELVAGLRADETDFVRGLNEAELAMRGLTRDVNGQLRDLQGRFVTDSEAMGRSLSGRIGLGARQAAQQVAKVGPAIAALGVGVPVVAAVTTAFMGLAAGAVSAGLAVKAFQLAAKPQLEKVTEVSVLAEEAQKAVASGAEDAAEKQKAYADALKQLPPATQDTAKAFIGLKGDYKSWSDEMSGTTMPIFTKGIGILRDLLPTLTPFVKAAANAIGGFLDKVAVGVKSAGFKQWAADMAAAAGPALANFLTFIKNLAVGFGALLQAFLPASGAMTGGLVSMSAAFASWAASLKGSEGFAEFLALASEGGTTLGQLAIAVGNLLVAMGPLIGVTTQVALALARVINALPPEVLSVLATTIGAVVVAMKLYAIGARAVALANALLASSAYRAIAGWTRMMAVGLAAYVRIAAAAVASAATTAAAWIGSALASIGTWLAAVVRAGITSAATFLMMAARAVVWAATMAASWLVAMGPIGWIIMAVIALVALIILYWDEIKAFTIAAWNAIVAWVKGAAQKIWDLFLSWTIIGLVIKHWDTIKAKTIAVWNAIVAWVKKIPGWIYQAFLNWTALGLLIKHWSAMKSATIRKATELIAWVKGIPGRVKSAMGNLGSVLVGAGRALIQGFISGIKNMIGSVKNAASSVVSAARDYFPFSPAKEGPFAGKGYTTYSGQALMSGFVKGIEGGIPMVDRALAGLAPVPAVGQMAVGAGMAAGSALGSPSAKTVRVELGGELGDWVIGTIRARVGSGAGGDVQLYLGNSR